MPSTSSSSSSPTSCCSRSACWRSRREIAVRAAANPARAGRPGLHPGRSTGGAVYPDDNWCRRVATGVHQPTPRGAARCRLTCLMDLADRSAPATGPAAACGSPVHHRAVVHVIGLPVLPVVADLLGQGILVQLDP